MCFIIAILHTIVTQGKETIIFFSFIQKYYNIYQRQDNILFFKSKTTTIVEDMILYVHNYKISAPD